MIVSAWSAKKSSLFQSSLNESNSKNKIRTFKRVQLKELKEFQTKMFGTVFQSSLNESNSKNDNVKVWLEIQEI